MSVLFIIPIGLFDLFKCSVIRCIIIIIIISMGIIKCIVKNRLIKIMLMLKLPQIIITILFPKTGIALMKFVITIIAQYDIWFQINEYPKNDSIINMINMIIPVIHILFMNIDL